MTAITLRAVRAVQGNLTLYTTGIAVRDLVSPGFYSVETLDPTDTNDSGYQRLLNETRARRLADYLLKGLDTKDSFLPTSVFLATAATLNFDHDLGLLTVNPAHTGAFSVVDGQHRLEGLRLAAEKDERLLAFEMPVNIAVGLPHLHQMCHFLIVNSTQKSVDKSVEQRILSRLTKALDVEDVPNLPRWIQKIVDRGEVDQAVKMVDYLNATETSPWLGKVRLPNVNGDGNAIRQHSFVKNIVKYVLTPSNPISAFDESEKRHKVFLNYWTAIANILDDGEDSVIFKYNGVDLFCRFSTPLFMRCQDRNSFTVATMQLLLSNCFKNMEGEYAGVGHAEWWSKGSSAGSLNASAISNIYTGMAVALSKAAMASDVEI
jgi:DGQHR domain-containing protein